MIERCEHCGASLKKYWHSLTPGLVKVLIKCYVYASEHDNEFMMKNLNLDHSEYGNFQKLRFHALIAKKKEDGEKVERTWLITARGADFLKNSIVIPARVQTFRNRVVDHSEEHVTVGDVMKSEPYWEKEFDFSLFEPKQISLI